MPSVMQKQLVYTAISFKNQINKYLSSKLKISSDREPGIS